MASKPITTVVPPADAFAGTKKEDKDALYETIGRLNDAIDREWVANWASKRGGRRGTTIILCGVRQHFRAAGNDFGQATILDKPPRVRIDFLHDANDMVLLSESPDERDRRFRDHPTAGRPVGEVARMDYSCRAFLELMFLTDGEVCPPLCSIGWLLLVAMLFERTTPCRPTSVAGVVLLRIGGHVEHQEGRG